MTSQLPAEPGSPLSAIDTPALIIDLDAFEANLRRMADYVGGHEIRLRAHAKTHKSPIIARKQMALGAIGICCQKVSEAEIMVAGGVDNVLVSNEIVGSRKLDRLAALARQAEIAVCADCPSNIEALGQAAEKFGVRLTVLVEIDVGAGRCGVAPGEEALGLARAIDVHPALRFGGLQAYHGSAQHIRGSEERRHATECAVHLTRETVTLLESHGLASKIIGGGGTGSFEIETASGLYNELQAGSYIFMDADYARNHAAEGSIFESFSHALFIFTTVMSRPAENRAIVDAGLKAVSVDSGLPEVVGDKRVRFTKISDEHGVLTAETAGILPGYGEKLLVIPGHCDPTVNMHDFYVCVRGLNTAGAHVEAVWPVAARGALF
jgi:D-serine deaminase-like pyridoxal phosphate-dependent protein